MKNKMELTDHEQDTLTSALMAISEILLLKMDEGIDKPTIEGVMNVDNEDKEVLFSFTAQRK